MKHKLLFILIRFIPAIMLMSSCGGNSLVGIYDVEVNKEYSAQKTKLIEQDPELKYLIEDHMNLFVNSFFGRYDGAEIIFNEDSTGNFNGEIIWEILDDTLVVIRKSSTQWNNGAPEDISFRIKKIKGFNKIEFYYAKLFKPGTDELIKYAFTITRNKEKEQKANSKAENNSPRKSDSKLDKKINYSNNISVKGGFSIAHEKKVLFSPGNLQYQASTKTWRFAENQYDIIGMDNSNISEYYDGWIDLFGWGTSGFNGKEPYMMSTESDDYYIDDRKDIAGTNYDWGEYNAISNGGNKAGIWRTLRIGEVTYMFFGRPHHEKLWSWGCINGINGIILLPDDWEQPIGLTFIPSGKDYYKCRNVWNKNIYTVKEWTIMEGNGAIFLPVAGKRKGINVWGLDGNKDLFAVYWASTSDGERNWGADTYGVWDYSAELHDNFLCNGHSVRLVKDVE